jgi:hypothetical protein
LRDKYDSVLNGVPQNHLQYFEENNIGHVNSSTLNSLPYSQDELFQLKDCIMVWLLDLGVFSGLFNFVPNQFEQILDSLKNGTIFIKLITIIFGSELKGIHRKPLSYSNFVNNIRRVLDFLKKEKKMSTKFLWRVNDIVEGKELVI